MVPMCCSNAFSQAVNLYDQVNPFIGTSGGGLTSAAASLPFGMIQWDRPRTKKATSYRKTLLREGSVSPTYMEWDVRSARIYRFYPGAMSCERAQVRPALPSSSSQKDTSTVRKRLILVTLANGTRVELTVTNRSGIARFTLSSGCQGCATAKYGRRCGYQCPHAGCASIRANTTKTR